MAGPNGRPGVGIVSDVVLQRHRLQAATGKFGLDVSFSGDPERLMDYPAFPDAALWLVTLEDEADHPALFEHLLENTEAPVLFGLDQAPKPGTTEYFRWERRLLDKLEKQLGHLEQLDTANDIEELAETTPDAVDAPTLPHWITPAAPGSVAEEVWILGASLGGPAAVKTFLDHLPPRLPVGLSMHNILMAILPKSSPGFWAGTPLFAEAGRGGLSGTQWRCGADAGRKRVVL